MPAGEGAIVDQTTGPDRRWLESRLVTISDAVRHQAMHPFVTLSAPSGWQKIDAGHCLVLLHPLPYPIPVEPSADLTPDAVDAALEEARSLARGQGNDTVVWLCGPDHPWLGEELTRRGLRNEDSPGYESTENAMALVEPPAGRHAEELRVALVESFEDYAAGVRVEAAAFEISEEDRAELEAGLPARWADYAAETNELRRWNASIDGRVVGTAEGMMGPGGLNLFGGAVVQEARGKGAYRALVSARWEYAVAHGTPALTVQAGRMSMPVLERLGFQHLAEMRMYVDDLSA